MPVPTAIDPGHRRRGFTYLELQVAFAILGITMAGLCPIVVAQLRMAERMERRVYCILPRETSRLELVDRSVLALGPGGAASPGGLWSRRLGATRVGMRLETVDLSRGRGLELAAPGGDWILRLDPAFAAEPTWFAGSGGLPEMPPQLVEAPAATSFTIESRSDDPAQVVIRRSGP